MYSNVGQHESDYKLKRRGVSVEKKFAGARFDSLIGFNDMKTPSIFSCDKSSKIWKISPASCPPPPSLAVPQLGHKSVNCISIFNFSEQAVNIFVGRLIAKSRYFVTCNHILLLAYKIDFNGIMSAILKTNSYHQKKHNRLGGSRERSCRVSRLKFLEQQCSAQPVIRKNLLAVP